MTPTDRPQLDLLVKRMTWEADGVLCWLVDPDGKPLPDWPPGAHIDLPCAAASSASTPCAATPPTPPATGSPS